MPAYIAKQPNGLYCRFSTVIDTVTDWNLTEQQYIDLHVKRAMENAKEEANYILTHRVHDFSEVISDFRPYNDSVEEFNQLLIEMGETQGLPPERREYLENFQKEIHEEKD